MSEAPGWAWGGVLLLGVWHGINPAMGWLFAVALGMQERRVAAVWAALVPLAAGHAVAITAAVVLAGVLGVVLPAGSLRWVVAGLLCALGVYRLARGGHPRFGGLRIGPMELAIWSFLMATAHGAGLMVIPVVMETGRAAGQGMMLHSAGVSGGLSATLLHTVGYLLTVGGLATLVYTRLGLRRLRELWVNLDLLWGGALVLTGVVTPLLR